MASTVTRKRPRTTPKKRNVSQKSVSERYLVDAHGKRVAIVLDLEEYRQLVAGRRSGRAIRARLPAAQRAKLVALARQAKGSWKDSEGRGTAVAIVRQLRDEWR